MTWVIDETGIHTPTDEGRGPFHGIFVWIVRIIKSCINLQFRESYQVNRS